MNKYEKACVVLTYLALGKTYNFNGYEYGLAENESGIPVLYIVGRKLVIDSMEKEEKWVETPYDRDWETILSQL